VKRRERLLLGVLAVLVVIVAGLRLPALFSRSSGRGGARDSGRVGGPPPEVETLRWSDLEARPGEYHTSRDPFRYGEPPAPPPPGPTPEELAEMARLRAQEEAARRALEAERARLAAVPQPPRIELAYLGSFGPEARRIAVFSDGKNIYNAFEGDVLEGKFIVHRIGFESVDLKFVGFPQEPARRLAVGR
jgi:hypothetical protein